MKPQIQSTLLTLALLSTIATFYVTQPSTLFAQGTAFTYQGRLNSGASAANGVYDLRFAVYDAASNGNLWGTVTNSATTVTNGLFTVTLDFGTGVFTGASRWLDIAVRTNGAGTFTTLTPRQQVLPTPYAITAENLDGSLPVSQVSGVVPLAQLPAVVLTNNAAGVALNGTFAGNGAGLTNLTGLSGNILTNGAPSATLGNLNLTNLYLPATTAGAGIIFSGGNPLVQAYGSYNFFGGLNAGNLTMSGQGDTGSGFWALYSNTSGSWNVADGAWALWSNLSGSWNVADGQGALNYNLSGSWNTASGFQALFNNMSGSNNIALGSQAGYNVVSNNNIDIGNAGISTDNGIIRIGTPGLQTQTFIAGTVNLAGNLNLPSTTAGAGVIYAGGNPLIHSYGTNNFFAGFNAGNLSMSGSDNVGIGYYALWQDTSGSQNTAEGFQALYSNTSGYHNTANGFWALANNTIGNFNTADGSWALFHNTSGVNNTADGYSALCNNTNGNYNTASGFQALLSNTGGSQNTAVGNQALFYNTVGNDNTANGVRALFSNTLGINNTANGFQALQNNTNGYNNTATGVQALQSNTSGSDNTANGLNSLLVDTTGYQNTAVGSGALQSNITGSGNIAVGFQAGYNLTTGNNNIDIGNPGVSSDNGIIRLGTPGTHTSTYIAGTLNVNDAIRTSAGIVFPDGSVQTRAAVESTAPLVSSGYTNGTTVTFALNGESCSMVEPLVFRGSVVLTSVDGLPVLRQGEYQCATVKLERVQTAGSTWATAFRRVLDYGVSGSSNYWFALSIVVAQGSASQTITVSNLVPTGYSLTGGNGQLLEQLELTAKQSYPLTITRSGSTAAGSPSADVPDLSVLFNGVSQTGVVLASLDIPADLSFGRGGITNTLGSMSVGTNNVTLRANVSAGASLCNWFASGTNWPIAAARTDQGVTNILFSAQQAVPAEYRIRLADDGLPIEELVVTYCGLFAP